MNWVILHVSQINLDSSLNEFKQNDSMIRIIPDINYHGFIGNEEIDVDDDEKFFWFNSSLWKKIKIHPVFKIPVFNEKNDFYYKWN